MGILSGGFNANDVPPAQSFEPIPAGKYKALITASEEKPTSKGDGSYLQLEFQIIEGEFENRKVWARLNLNNPNDQAVGIARKDLSAICHAVNVMELSDSEQLHDIPLLIKVGVKPAKDNYEASNTIKGYEPVGESTPAKTSAPAPKPSQSTTAPWKKPASAGK